MKDIFTPDLGVLPIDCVTMAVSMDEPCFGVSEVDMQSPGYQGFHRYLIIEVMRDDKKVSAYIDKGLSKNFRHRNMVRIPGGVKDKYGKFHIVHTVGELLDISDYLYEKPSFDKVELACTKSGAERIKT